MAYDWAQYKRNQRGHGKGDHSNCDPRRCDFRREIDYQNDAHLFALALFEELANRHLDPLTWFGDGFDQAKALAEAQFPEWLPQEPDFVHRAQARAEFS